MSKAFIIISSLLVTFTAFASDSIDLASGPAPLKSIVEKVKDPFEKESNIKINVQGTGGVPAPTVITLIDSGKAEVGIAGVDWDSVIKLIESKGTKLANKDQLQKVEIGREPTYFVVHPMNNAELSNETLTKVLAGKVKNWKEVGGPDSPVIIVAPSKFPATQQLISERLMKGEALKGQMKYFASFKEISDFVAGNPGAIGFGSTDVLSSSVKNPKHPELFRSTYFITKGAPSERAQKLLSYIKKNQK